MTPTGFTIRVYGLLIHGGSVLLSRENIRGSLYTKFPGGGLEFGEGVIECLQREFMEELAITLCEWDHFYTTEDYIPSSFHHDSRQVLSIYYTVKTDQLLQIQTDQMTDQQLLLTSGGQNLYWCTLDKLLLQDIQLPIDKIVVEKLLKDS